MTWEEIGVATSLCVAVAAAAFSVGRLSTIRNEMDTLRDESKRENERARDRVDRLEQSFFDFITKQH